MWQYALNDYKFPEYVSEDTFRKYKQNQNPKDPLTAFIGCGCAFAGWWFETYARRHKENAKNDFAKTAAKSIKKKVEMFNWEYDEMVCGLEIPILFVDSPYKMDGRMLPADQLYMDNTSGVYQVVSRMLKAGIRRIGFIGDFRHCESFFERYMAFRGAMMLGNEPVPDELIIDENHAEFMEPRLRELKELPELFICANDFVAVDAMQVLRKMGKTVPDDVMIAGFDDSAESILVQPPLTTIHIHTQIMAYSAMHLLISRIEDPSLDTRTVYTETYLVWRESASAEKRGNGV